MTASRVGGQDAATYAVARGTVAGDDWITVPRERIRDALQGLRAEGWTTLSFLTAVDHLRRTDTEPPFTGLPPEQAAATRWEIVYQLRRNLGPEMLRVRVFIPGDDPSCPSVADLYAPADWDEREMWDLMGIRFEGHPDLKRILMPDEWEGHPLRRDFPVGGEPVDFSKDHEEWQTRPGRA